MNNNILCFSTFILLFAASSATTPVGFVFPILKDSTRLQYYTPFNIGTPPHRIYFSIDLNNPTNWFTGPLTGYNQSSSYHPVTVNTTACTAYCGPLAAYNGNCTELNPPSPLCNNLQCSDWASSPLRLDPNFGDGYGLDPVVEDVLSPLYRRATLAKASLLRFPFVDTLATGPLKGLSHFSKGIVSLARNPWAMHAQISSAFKIPKKFAICLPSSTSSGINGAVYFGGGPYVLPPSTVNLANYMYSVPLVSNSHSVMNAYEPADPSVAYFIKTTSIVIDGAPVKFNTSLLSFDKNGDGGVQLSTMEPYTKLDSRIFPAFVATFVQQAKALNITVAPGVGSFKTCFNSASIKYDPRIGRGIPVIDFITDRSRSWRIYGSNSLVKVSSDVQCLGFFEEGSKQPVVGFRSATPAIIVGGKQMEDSLVEFDLEANKVGFTVALSRFGTSCSQFKGI